MKHVRILGVFLVILSRDFLSPLRHFESLSRDNHEDEVDDVVWFVSLFLWVQ